MEKIRTHGYALIRGHCPNEQAKDAFRQLGEIEKMEGLDLIQTLVPRQRQEAPPNTYSGNFGKGDFPLHSDLAHWANPPRYLGLRCKIGNINMPTKLLQSEQVIKEIGVHALQRTLVQPRRPIQGRKQLLRLLDLMDAGTTFRLRWDSIYIRPASRLSTEIYSRVSKFLSNASPLEITLVEPGDTLIIDNWKCLHGRSPANKYHRHIDRAYFTSISHD
jgi:hypothetical protein